MSAADFSGLNAACITAFANLTTNPPCLYSPNPAIPTNPLPFQIQLIGVDPLRQEGTQDGTFHLRWGKKADFDAVQGIVQLGYAPVKGDTITIEDGTVYRVEMVQTDQGGGYRMMCQKKVR